MLYTDVVAPVCRTLSAWSYLDGLLTSSFPGII